MNLKEEIQKLYGSDSKVYGPYTRKQDGRQIIRIKSPDLNTTKLLSKCMLEIQHGRVLSKEDTVDHINNDPLHDSFDNIQLLTRNENSRKSADISHIKRYIRKTPKEVRRAYYTGALNSQSKLSDSEVEHWRIRFHNNEVSISDIEHQTGSSRRAVENFIRGKSYETSPGPISKIKMRRVFK